jgi:hypothetical protein
MRATFLGGDPAEAPADPVRDPVVSVSPLVRVVPVSSSCRTQHVIRLVALIWALLLGHASIAESLAAREVARAPKGPDLAARVDQILSDSHTRAAQSEHGSRLHSHKRPSARSKIVLWYNPNGDDETSRDSDDDDDTSDDLNDDDDDDTDVPIVVWLQDLVPYMIVLEAESAPVWTETLYSPFPAQQRLRC